MKKHDLRGVGVVVVRLVKTKGRLKSDSNKGHFHEDHRMFLIVCRSLPLRVTNVSNKICRRDQNTHFMPNNPFSNTLSFVR